MVVELPNDPGCLSSNDSDENDDRNSQLSAVVTINDDWNSGYCASVVVNNPSSSTVVWQVSFDIDGIISDLWNALYQQQDSTITASGVDWNRQVAANGSVKFGFCANR